MDLLFIFKVECVIKEKTIHARNRHLKEFRLSKVWALLEGISCDSKWLLNPSKKCVLPNRIRGKYYLAELNS